MQPIDGAAIISAALRRSLIYYITAQPNFISKCELTYGKDAILPITDVEIENRCGYVFKGSTNRLEYID